MVSALCYYAMVAMVALVSIQFPPISLLPDATKIDLGFISAYIKQVQPKSVVLPSLTYDSLPDLSTLTITEPLEAVGRAKVSLTRRGIYTFYTAKVAMGGELVVTKSKEDGLCGENINDQVSYNVSKCTLGVHVSGKQDLTGMPIPSGDVDLCPKVVDALTSFSASTGLKEHPPLAPGASPMTSSLFFQAIQNIASEVNSLAGFTPSAEFVAPTAMHLVLTFQNPTHMQLNSSAVTAPSTADSDNSLSWLMPIIFGLLKRQLTLEGMKSIVVEAIDSLIGLNISELLTEEWVAYVQDALLQNTTLSMDGLIPAGNRITLDLVANDLRCSFDGYYCSVTRVDGLRITNLRVEGFDELGVLFAAFMSDSVESLVNMILNILATRLSSPTSERFNIPMRQADVVSTPHIAVIVVCPVVFFLFSVVIIARNLRMQRKSPVLTADGQPMSLIRVVIEDTVLCGLTFGTIMCFLLSDTTTVASVTVGRVIHAYAFSLMQTVTDLYASGLKPLAIFVFAFSGVYPYIKLVGILMFSVVLHHPDSRILKTIDYIGKFSFLDTFVMLVMAAGLEIPGVADVELMPPYYLFLAATISSIAVGNYACHYWRYGTDLRSGVAAAAAAPSLEREGNNNNNNNTREEEPVAVVDEEDADDDGAVIATTTSFFQSRTFRIVRQVLIVAYALVIGGLTLPSWICYILRYDAGGLASTATQKHRYYTLYTLSKQAGPACLVVTLATIAISPFVYALAFPRLPLLASWTAADVLLLAIGCGLLQLNQFLQFVLGGDYDLLYNAHAKMLWPLIPLLIASVLTWVLVVVDIIFFHKTKTQQLDEKKAASHGPFEENPTSGGDGADEIADIQKNSPF